jgi:hypothetical protein
MADTQDSTTAKTYILRMLDGSGVEREIEAESLDDARNEARDWAREGYESVEETCWISVRIFDADGEDIDDVTVTCEPREPKCREGEHDWQSPHRIVGGIRENPGVWGNGGGVVIHEVCVHCGTERVTDTWAQDRSTGRQGLTSIRYEAGKYEREVEALRDEAMRADGNA